MKHWSVLLLVLALATACRGDPAYEEPSADPVAVSDRWTGAALQADPVQSGTEDQSGTEKGDPQFALPATNLKGEAATFHVTWLDGCETPPAGAETALDSAAGIWGGLLSSSVTIEVSACWTSALPCDGIACGDTTTRVRNFPNALLVDAHYPIALANALAGSDLALGTADILVHFDAGAQWSFVAGRAPAGATDFVSVALHELAHGLGFAGHMYESYSVGFCGNGPYGHLYPCPTPYDWFAVDSGGVPLLSYLDADPRVLGARLESDARFGGPNALARNGDDAVKLYTPAIWQQGSSLSHLDPATFEMGENGLMTPGYGGVFRTPGPVTLALLQDMGWLRADGAPAVTASGPTVVSVGQAVTVTGILVWPGYTGQAMTYTWQVTDEDTITHSDLGVTDTITLSWGVPGVKTVGLTAAGGGVSASATRTTLVFDVAVDGPAQGETDRAYTFHAALTPDSTGFPVAYAWQATGLDPVIHPDQGVTDAAAFTWTVPGTKAVIVTATIDGAMAQAVHLVEIGEITFDQFIFLPLLQRN